VRDLLEQHLAHRDQGRRAARRHVEAPEQLLAGRLDRSRQGNQPGRARRIAPGFDGVLDRFGIRAELGRKMVEERDIP
jgi:hypothetical protein